MRRLQQAVAILAFLAFAFVAQTALAARTPPSAPSPATSAAPQNSSPPQNPQGGINTLVQPPPIQRASQPMLFEQYGPLDYYGITTGGFGINVINDQGNGLAVAMATILYLIGIVAVRIVEWSFTLDLVSQLGPVIDRFTQGLVGSLYQRYLPLVTLLAAIMAGWALLVMRRFLSGLTGLAWAAITLSVALQLFASPSTYLTRADQFADGLTNAIVVGVAQEDSSAPRGSYQQPADDAHYEVRLLANRLWMVSVYDPWTMIEFGTVDPTASNRDHLGVELLKKNAGQPNNYDQDLQAAPQWIQQWAAGNWGVPRAVFGFFMVVFGGMLLTFTLVIALAVIVGTLAAILLVCLMVPVWLLAPIPGFGQRLLMSWFGGIVAGLVVSTIGALYLVLVLSLLGAVALLTGAVGLVTVGLLDVGLIVCAMWLRKAFFNLGRHVAHLPTALAAGQARRAPTPRVEETGMVSRVAHRQMSRGRQWVSGPIQSYTGRQALVDGKSDLARGGAGKGAVAAHKTAARVAAGKGTGTAAATTGAGVATASLALAALAALKTGHGVLRVHDAARRRTQATVANALGAAASPGQAPLRHLAHGEPSVLVSAGRVTMGGVSAWRARRLRPADHQEIQPRNSSAAPKLPPRRVKTKNRPGPKR